jgi:hypothetical protein
MKPEDIWCREEGRQLSNDGVISYGNRKLQVTERRDMPQRSKVVVRITEDGSIRVIYRRLVSGEKREEMRENELKWQEHRPTQREPIEAKLAEARTPRGDRLPRSRPGANHPWRLKNSMDVAEALQVKRELQMQTTPQSG